MLQYSSIIAALTGSNQANTTAGQKVVAPRDNYLWANSGGIKAETASAADYGSAEHHEELAEFF